jgi:hypothetical protein
MEEKTCMLASTTPSDVLVEFFKGFIGFFGDIFKGTHLYLKILEKSPALVPPSVP